MKRDTELIDAQKILVNRDLTRTLQGLVDRMGQFVCRVYFLIAPTEDEKGCGVVEQKSGSLQKIEMSTSADEAEKAGALAAVTEMMDDVIPAVFYFLEHGDEDISSTTFQVGSGFGESLSGFTVDGSLAVAAQLAMAYGTAFKTAQCPLKDFKKAHQIQALMFDN